MPDHGRTAGVLHRRALCIGHTGRRRGAPRVPDGARQGPGYIQRCGSDVKFWLEPEDIAKAEAALERGLSDAVRYDIKVALVALPRGGYNIVLFNRRTREELRGLCDPSFVAFHVAQFTSTSNWKSEGLQIWLRPYVEGWATPTKGSRQAVAEGQANSVLGAYGVVEVGAFRKWLEGEFYAMEKPVSEAPIPTGRPLLRALVGQLPRWRHRCRSRWRWCRRPRRSRSKQPRVRPPRLPAKSDGRSGRAVLRDSAEPDYLEGPRAWRLRLRRIRRRGSFPGSSSSSGAMFLICAVGGHRMDWVQVASSIGGIATAAGVCIGALAGCREPLSVGGPVERLSPSMTSFGTSISTRSLLARPPQNQRSNLEDVQRRRWL